MQSVARKSKLIVHVKQSGSICLNPLGILLGNITVLLYLCTCIIHDQLR